MKKYFYYILMIICSIMVSVFLYYVALFGIIYYRFIPILHVDRALGYLLSPEMFGLIILIGGIIGYRLAKKWWKIIYIDKVYYFGKK